MIELLKHRITQIRKAAGIEIVMNTMDDYQINAVILSTSKNTILKETILPVNDINKLPQIIKTDIPVFVVINGKGILTRLVAPNEPDSKNVEAILPNAQEKDFYVDILFHDQLKIASLMRLETLKELTQKIEDHKYKVLGISIGFNAIQTVLPFMDLQSNVVTSSFQLNYNPDKTLSDFEVKHLESSSSSVNPEYAVSGQYVKANEILAFSAALTLLADDLNERDDHKISSINHNRKEYRYYKYYKAALSITLAIIFLSLFINFFIYDHYFRKNQELIANLTFTEVEAEKLGKMKNDIQKKELFLGETKWLEQTKISFFADRIAGLVPSGTVLNSMDIYPASKNKLNDGEFHFKKDTIIIAGYCNNPSDINMFRNNLKNIHDIKEITIKKYQLKQEDSTGFFLMEVITK